MQWLVKLVGPNDVKLLLALICYACRKLFICAKLQYIITAWEGYPLPCIALQKPIQTM